MPGDVADSAPDPRRWRALVVTLAAGFMTLLDVSIVNVALPSIQRGLHASPQGAQWVVSGYALTFGLTLIAGGRFGDVLGRRTMFLIALSAFVLTSAAAGAAPNELLLIVARLVQGVAAGLLTPQNTGLIQDMFRGAERGKAFGLFGSTVGLSTAAGPVIGGVILLGVRRRDRLALGVLRERADRAAGTGVRGPAGAEAGTEDRRLRDEIDYRGIALLGLTVLCLLLPLVQSEGGGTPILWLLVPFAALFGWLFLRWERRRVRRDRPPLLDPRLFSKTPGYSQGIVIGTIYFCGFSGIWLVLSLFLQDGLGYTPLQSGLAMTSFAVGSAGDRDRRWPAGRPVGPTADRDRAEHGGGRAGHRRAADPPRRRRAHRVRHRGSAAGGRDRRRRGDLAEHHAHVAVRANPDGGRGRWRVADRAAGRHRDRHRGAHRRVPDARELDQGLSARARRSRWARRSCSWRSR